MKPTEIKYHSCSLGIFASEAPTHPNFYLLLIFNIIGFLHAYRISSDLEFASRHGAAGRRRRHHLAPDNSLRPAGSVGPPAAVPHILPVGRDRVIQPASGQWRSWDREGRKTGDCGECIEIYASFVTFIEPGGA